jgi:hypothetical protein
MVRIFPDHPVYIMPKLQYNFYGLDTSLVRESDETGNFEGRLPPNIYRVLATNTDAAGMAFSGMESFDLATVTIDNDAALSTVYSVVVDPMELPDNGNILYEPSPALLTKQLVFIFTLLGDLGTEVVSITGSLPGVYPSLRLATGRPSPESATQSLSTSVRFEVSGQGVRRSARIGLLGLRDPEDGRVYTNNLALTLAMSGGGEEEATVDLTGVLSKIIPNNEGIFPPLITVSVELKPSDETGITGSVTEWEYGDEEVKE